MVTKTFKSTKPKIDILTQFRNEFASQISGADSDVIMNMDFAFGDLDTLPEFNSFSYCTAAGGSNKVIERHVLEGGIAEYNNFLASYSGPTRHVDMSKAQIESFIGTDPANPDNDFIYFEIIGSGDLSPEGGKGFEHPDYIDYSSCFLRGLLNKYGDVQYRFSIAYDTIHQSDTIVIKAGDSAERYDFTNEHP